MFHPLSTAISLLIGVIVAYLAWKVASRLIERGSVKKPQEDVGGKSAYQTFKFWMVYFLGMTLMNLSVEAAGGPKNGPWSWLIGAVQALVIFSLWKAVTKAWPWMPKAKAN